MLHVPCTLGRNHCVGMLWHGDEHEALTEDGWDEGRARDALAPMSAGSSARGASRRIRSTR